MTGMETAAPAATGSRPGSVALEVRGLCVEIMTASGPIPLLDDVGFRIARGDVLGLIGESGSGKTMTALSIMRLLPPAARVTAGSIRLGDTELLGLSESKMRAIRGGRIGFVFQDPMTTLNPVMTIGAQIKESLRAHGISTGRRANDRAAELLDLMGIASPRTRLGQYPHEFSGGMRQRIVIAMALACEPELLLADEPTTALDVTIQAQILELVQTLKAETGVACLWITHDLGVAASLCDDLAIMYAGQVVETGSIDEVFSRPRTPYTRGLIDALPRIDQHPQSRLPTLKGSPHQGGVRRHACSFAPRCVYRHDACDQAAPPLTARGESGVQARCFGTEQGGWIDGESLSR
jgi:oligopeptide/dipeptide ABC transporter ATP-binding protein